MTICDMSAYTTDAAHTYVQTVLSANGLGTILTGPSFFPNNLISYTFASYITGVNAINPNVTDTLRKSFSQSLDSILISCVYNIEVSVFYNPSMPSSNCFHVFLKACTADDFEVRIYFLFILTFNWFLVS